MGEIARGNFGNSIVDRTARAQKDPDIHPAWLSLIRYCAELGHGEIEKLKIQDGIPVIADVVREKVRFT